MNIARVEYYFAEFLSMLELPENSDKNLDIVTDVWGKRPERIGRRKNTFARKYVVYRDGEQRRFDVCNIG